MFRNGQWVLFEAPIPLDGAFHSTDGRTVGIYVAEHAGDAQVRAHPACIVVVRPNGEDLMIEVMGNLIKARVFPASVRNLAPVTDRRDIPPARIAHLPADWQPIA